MIARIVGFIVVLVLTGCMSLGQAIRDMAADEEMQRAPSSLANKEGADLKKRKYDRVRHKDLVEQAELSHRAGSLWVPEGQNSYLFIHNTHRLLGDLLNVKVDGHPKEQLETKTKVIKTLLEKIKKQELQRSLANQDQSPADGAAGGKAAPPPPPKAEASEGAEASGKEFPIKTVPTRIVEILKDGNYQVKGDQPFMIDQKEYKLIVTGIVRSQDFSDDGLGAEKLLDPKFDIVSVKKE